MKKIDCLGMACPMPVINTKKYFDSIEERVAEVLVDNEVAKNNICKYAEGCGYNFDASEKEGNYIIKIEKNGENKIEKKEDDFVIVLGTDKLGQGNDDLGTILMKGYLYTLSESGVKILSCGTCLDFYGIKDDLAIGEISNMYTIVESMNTSNKVIKL